ncbi:aldehyde oxidase GLOX [Ziziphus jujuba]|uniref:Aldehyde oxidase GLOX n=1 Tax=Ziziphus jujuba TaxID=326968 RepID=A0ABM3I2F6_ZIZJJ|nr:aldehyde oxidase GLOX [Ziziphus jujuba]
MASFIKNPFRPPSFFFYLIGLSCLFEVSTSVFNGSAKTTPSLDTISGGHWFLLHSSVGVSAMHMQLLKSNKVVIFDRTDVGPSNLSLPHDKCIRSPRGTDCTAHSLLYDIVSNTFRPLTVHTDTWCSSGSVNPDGVLVQTGGYGEGIRKVRTFPPSDDNRSDWTELSTKLWERRWYATNQVLPDGRTIIVGGRLAFSYEFFPKKSANDGSFSKLYYLSFLKETRDPYEENNLYPFLHLLPDGNLFIFANKRSILFDYNRNSVVREFPIIPGDFKRNYPSTGSSVLLPLRLDWRRNGTVLPEAQVMICGGSPPGAFNMSNRARIFVSASNTCGRIRVTDPKPKWVMEEMPMPRVMSEMVLLPTGDVIIINGATKGTAGWEDAVNPVFNPVLYLTYEPDPERRFMVLNPSRIPRMYHSTAVLLPDGRILVGGSNPHKLYNFTAYPYPTELSLEAFHPYYLDPQFVPLRPSIISVGSRQRIVFYGQRFSVVFVLALHRPNLGISVVLMTPSFSTHSLGMNQRMLVMEVVSLAQLSTFAYKITVGGPPTGTVAPPGYYMLFVVHAGVPSPAVWVKVQ